MLKPGSFQEKILVGKLKSKNKEAFGKLYDIYVDKIYRFIYFKVSRVEATEDLTSQTFLKIWQFALEDKIRTEKSFQSFLYKTARNVVIDYYRKSNKDKDLVSLDEAIDVPGDEDSEVLEQEVDAKIEMKEVEEKLKKLKSEYQEIIVLYYINELSIKELAEVLNKKKGNVRVILHRAIKALKDK